MDSKTNPADTETRPRRGAKRSRKGDDSDNDSGSEGASKSSGSSGEAEGRPRSGKDYRRPENRRGGGRRGGRKRRRPARDDDGTSPREGSSDERESDSSSGEARSRSSEARSGEPSFGEGVLEEKSPRERGGRGRASRGRSRSSEGRSSGEKTGSDRAGSDRAGSDRGGSDRGRDDEAGGRSSRSRRRGSRRSRSKEGRTRATESRSKDSRSRSESSGARSGEFEGILLFEHKGHGSVRLKENGYLPDKKRDVHVSPRMAQKLGLRDGSLIKGTYGPGQGKHRFELRDVIEVDGGSPKEQRKTPVFKSLTSIAPDFHYAVGDLSGDLSLRIVDLVCPVGRGQRGLIVAPPRTGKTMLLQAFALAMEEHYEDVEVMVLLVDERPEEATEWQRTMKRGTVFVSTNDEMAQRHVDLAELVWKRSRRLVELGKEVFLVIDSVTRLARAYNNCQSSGGRTMSGGIDSRTMERPKQFFGSARNTETAGSLTILGTTLIETGSRMDQVIFEEFKGTGNMELVLSRKLADRRIFPALDIQRSGTRKEERMLSANRLRLTNTLRRVLMRMSFIEAMELLVTKLDDFESNEEFLARFEVDPEE